MKHKLKTMPCYFDAVLAGEKQFEIRFNDDRGFQKGDEVTLMEYDSPCMTGRECVVEITFVTNYQQKTGFVVFGFKIKESDK